MPSCIRLPPVATSDTTGSRRCRARWNASATRRPAASPIEPPRKPNSNTTSATSVSPIVALPHTTDSGSPVRSAARARASS